MKKRIMVLGILLVMVLVAGCALFTPPPYVHQEMEVKKGDNYYKRSVKGFTHSDPDTVIYDWGDTVNIIEDDDPNNSNNNTINKKDRGYEGIIKNDKYHYSYQVSIYKGKRTLAKILRDRSKHLIATLAICSRHDAAREKNECNKEKIKLPYLGNYTIIWERDEEIKSHQHFSVKKGVIKKCLGESCMWFSHMPKC